MTLRFIPCGLLFLAFFPGSLLTASSVSYAGSFLHDNDVKLISLTVPVASTVTFRSFSYAGGVNGAGTVVPSGGFDPVIDLFDSTGLLINENDDGLSGQVGTDPITLQNFDFYLKTALSAGTYTVAVAQYDNFAQGPNLSNGFYETSPTFTAGPGFPGCSNGSFCDIDGANRTANWAFDVTETAATVGTPEPAGAALLLSGLAIIAVLGKRRGLTARR